MGPLNLPTDPDRAVRLGGSNIGRIYSRLAPIYGFWGALTEKRARERAGAAAELRPGELVLEVAVGTGSFLAPLGAAPGLGRVVGVDLAEGMIRRANRLIKSMPGGRAVLAQADAQRLPFANHSFDVLFNFYMLDLLPEDRIPNVLVEFRRVLKPSGRLVALAMAPQAEPFDQLWMWLYWIAPAFVGGCRPVPVADFLERGGWRLFAREMISQHGFRSELFVARPPGREA